MEIQTLILAVTLKIICVHSRIIPVNREVVSEDSIGPAILEAVHTKDVSSSRGESESEKEADSFESSSNPDEQEVVTNKPCSVVMLSDVPNNNMQSLLRRYRYNANGVLIPGSVKYFIKLPRGLENKPILVPLNNKAYSPLGGFVRYYKEVPPIPQSW